MTALAKQMRVRRTTVRNILLAAGVSLRTYNENNRRTQSRLKDKTTARLAHAKSEVIRLYQTGKSIAAIARQMRVRNTTIRNLLVIAGVSLRTQSDIMLRSWSRKKVSTESRFWSKVDKNGPIIRLELGPCWIWTASRNASGYGTFGVNRRSILAHRFSFESQYGPLPQDKPAACHKCDNPPCVRPDHLFAGTWTDNNHDKNTKGRNRWSEEAATARRVLSQSDAVHIRELYAVGNVSQDAIAQQFGVSQSTISAIVRKKFYRFRR